MAERAMSFAGIFILLGVAVLFSSDRKRISWRLVAWGVALQVAFAVLILWTKPGLRVFEGAQMLFGKLYQYTNIGTSFLFGGPLEKLPVIVTIICVITFISSLMAVLYYLRIIQALVFVMAKVMQVTMRASGAEALVTAFQVFMGIEATTAIKKYLDEMTTSELFTMMVAFMGTSAGTMLVIFSGVFGMSAGHLMAASIMSAPACIVMSKILVPETGEPRTAGAMRWDSMKSDEVNVIDAAATGAADGVKLGIAICAMLLAFVTMIGMLDAILKKAAGVSFSDISGHVFAPVAFILGVPKGDCAEVGKLLGVKVIFNEFLAFQQMTGMRGPGGISPRAAMICTYALCSFANFGSIAILIGGVGGLAPSRKNEVARLGLKSLLAGALAGFMTAAIAGFLIYKLSAGKGRVLLRITQITRIL